MKKWYAGIAMLLTAVFVFGGGLKENPKNTAVVRTPDAEYQFVVLHTNDYHGGAVAENGKGGAASLATFVAQTRAANENVLLLDAGDVNTGGAVSNMFFAEPEYKAYSMMAYDAVTFGNHEFDVSLEQLEKQMQIAGVPFVSANVKRRNGKSLGTAEYLIREFEGIRVGIFGLTTLRTTVLENPDESLTFTDEIKTAEAVVDELRNKKKVDIVILLGHIGDVKESADHVTSPDLAAAVPGIDIIVDGHSHSLFESPLVVGSTRIITAGSYGKTVGKAVVTVRNGKIIGFDWDTVVLSEDVFPPDPAVAAMLRPYEQEAEASLSEVVMQAAEPFANDKKQTRYGETALGNFICDAFYARLTAIGHEPDFVLLNGGGIRASIPAGAVTKGDILTVLPFNNYLYVITLKGSDVLDVFDFIATVPQGAGAFPSVSKQVRYTVNYKTGKTENLTVNGRPVDPDAEYTIGTINYLAEGGDGYEVFKRSTDSFNTSILYGQMLLDYCKSLSAPAVPYTDGRVIVIGGK